MDEPFSCTSYSGSVVLLERRAANGELANMLCHTAGMRARITRQHVFDLFKSLRVNWNGNEF